MVDTLNEKSNKGVAMYLIDRDRLLKSLKECDIPVTRSEEEIILNMPRADEQETAKFKKIKEEIRKRNRPIAQSIYADDELVEL